MADTLAALKSRIALLQVLYIVLFFGSLVILVLQYAVHIQGLTVPWAILLGGAVATRLIRRGMVTKYNTLLAGGGPIPLE